MFKQLKVNSLILPIEDLYAFQVTLVQQRLHKRLDTCFLHMSTERTCYELLCRAGGKCDFYALRFVTARTPYYSHDS